MRPSFPDTLLFSYLSICLYKKNFCQVSFENVKSEEWELVAIKLAVISSFYENIGDEN